MKLFHLVLWRISLALIVVLTVWAGFFYMAVVEEVNDEVDDTLEDYSEGLVLCLERICQQPVTVRIINIIYMK